MSNGNLRAWVGTLIAALIATGIGGYDAFFDHSAVFGAAGDATFILAGLGALGLKTAFDVGVNVPPPKA